MTKSQSTKEDISMQNQTERGLTAEIESIGKAMDQIEDNLGSILELASRLVSIEDKLTGVAPKEDSNKTLQGIPNGLVSRLFELNRKTSNAVQACHNLVSSIDASL